MLDNPSFETVYDSLNHIGEHDANAEHKTALRNYLLSQVKLYAQHPEQGTQIAHEIGRLKDTQAADELHKNYLPCLALNYAGNLELPKHHHGGVTWDMLAEVIEALPQDDTSEFASREEVGIIQNADVPLEERRRVLNSHLRYVLSVRNKNPELETDIAYWLAGMMGSPTYREMGGDYQYYRCLDLAANLALPESQRNTLGAWDVSVGTWDLLVKIVQSLPQPSK